jgi:glycosyltransferase involved in cell wall biosynthesis
MSSPALAIVVQRYGSSIIGGAETHARTLAQRLVGLGYRVEVFTTAASNYQSWSQDLPVGKNVENGVTVRRFSVNRRRSPFFSFYNLVGRAVAKIDGGMTTPRSQSRLNQAFEKAWIQAQGPETPELLVALDEECRSGRYQSVLFFSYLYYPTLLGLPKLAEMRDRPRLFIVPTAHPELPFNFFHTKQLLQAADGILANSAAEEALITSIFPQVAAKISVIGIGVDDPLKSSPLSTEDTVFLQKVTQYPYALYLGRISRGKGIPTLLKAFKRLLAQKAENKLHLVLAGEEEVNCQHFEDPSIIYTGPVSAALRDALIVKATVVVNPSPLESLSMVALEAMLAQKPLLLNAACAVFRDYGRFPGVTLFANEFELEKLLQKDWRKTVNMHEARSWVTARYSWEIILKTYENRLFLSQ